MPSRLFHSVRLAAALAVSLLLAACGVGSDAGTDWQVPPGADTEGMAAALGAFADGSVPDAFARLDAVPYRVEVTVVELDPDDDDAEPLGRFERTLTVAPGEAPRVIATTVRGSLADSAGLDAASLLPADPFPALLPDDVPFLDLRTRGAYRVERTPTNLDPQVVAEVADASAARPLVRRAVVRERSLDRSLSVLRASESAIYDEESTVIVTLARGTAADPNAELPTNVTVRTETATPLQRRRIVTTWAITPLAQPDTTNTREP